MKKKERLQVEDQARDAINELLGCSAISAKLEVGADGPRHEFDIYAKGRVIGGVSTGTHKTSNKKSNTGSCDRACAELLWLSLWPGSEMRVHVLSDIAMADWLVRRFEKAPFARQIEIYHFDRDRFALKLVGTIGPLIGDQLAGQALAQ